MKETVSPSHHQRRAAAAHKQAQPLFTLHHDSSEHTLMMSHSRMQTTINIDKDLTFA